MEYTKTNVTTLTELSDDSLEKVSGGNNDDAVCRYIRDVADGQYIECPEKKSNSLFNFGWRCCDSCSLCPDNHK